MTFSLALPFDTNNPEFARGVEIGRLWEQLKAAPEEHVEQMVHVTNAEMLARIAEALDRQVCIQEHNATWMTAEFWPTYAHRERGGG